MEKTEKKLGSRVNNFKTKAIPRKNFRQYTLTIREEVEGEIKNVIKKYKFLKSARERGNKANRENAFVSLYNHNGIPLCL